MSSLCSLGEVVGKMLATSLCGGKKALRSSMTAAVDLSAGRRCQRLRNSLRTLSTNPIAGGKDSVTCHFPVLHVDPQKVHPPLARYVHACRIPAGETTDLVVTSGQLALATDGSVPSCVQEQTRLVLSNLQTILQQAGGSLAHVIRLNAYVTDRQHLPGYMKARDEVMGAYPPTASTLMIVSGFTREEFLVEIEAMAAIPRSPAKRSGNSGRQLPPQQSQRRSFSTRRTTLGTIHRVASTASRPFHRQSRGVHTTILNDNDPPKVDPEAMAQFCSELQSHDIPVFTSDNEDSRREIKRRSKDFYWYSPILKPLLRNRVADLLIVPRTEADVVLICAKAVTHQVFLTTRGAGTGNYGQAVPLHGGAILDVSQLNHIEMVDTDAGILRAGAGAKLAEMEEVARKHGWELRQHPSTRQQATIGGFVAGGSTGHGALLHGGLSEDGAVLGVRVVTAEAEPRVLELEGRDVFPVVHAYGTNGIITSVDMPLARAQPWTDSTIVFASLHDASAFALDVANAPAIVKRAVSVYQAPIPHRFFDADDLLHAPGVSYSDPSLQAQPDSRHVCTVQCAATSIGAMERLAIEQGGQVTRIIPSDEAPRPYYEFGWNHTTLHAIKKDKSTTYLQAVLPPENALDLVKKIEGEFDTSELMQHLEVVNFQGRMGFAALSLLWPSGEDRDSKNQRLVDILRWHEYNGMAVFDPHTHILEDGGMKQTDWAQLGFKRKVDPSGILNPGKMRAWEEQSATVDQADDPRGAFAAAYRLADNSAIEGACATGQSSASDSKTDESTGYKPTPRSRFWAEWSTRDFATADLKEAVAILPIGAVEAHGPHLPLGVDAMHNADLLGRALARLPTDTTVLALPAMEVGVSCEHANFAGTLELSAETAAAAWCDIGASVARTGIRKLVVYNSHGGNHALAEVVARQLRQKHGMLCVLAMNLAQGLSSDNNSKVASLFPEEEVRYGIHGGAVETSLMMHLRPHLVAMKAAQDFTSRASQQPQDAALQMHAVGFSNKVGWMSQDLNPAGVVGAAASGSDAEKGAILADACVEGLVKLLVEMHQTDVDEILGNESLYPPQGPPPSPAKA